MHFFFCAFVTPGIIPTGSLLVVLGVSIDLDGIHRVGRLPKISFLRFPDGPAQQQKIPISFCECQ